jgi:hypothetical protein
MAVITFDSALAYTGETRVYVRANWEDDWTEVPAMTADKISWSLWPSIPIAEVVFHYTPKFLAEDATTWAASPKIDYLGYYIKITSVCEDGTLVWVGFIDNVVDYQGGTEVTYPTGTQRFICYSLSHVFGFERILRCQWWDGTTARTSGSAIAFNAGGEGNRTATKPAGEDSHLFSPDILTSEFWSSRDIAEYLIAQHSPKDKDGVVKITWVLQNLTLLPDWDSPELQCDGATVWDLLNQLLNRRLFLSAWDGYDEINNEADINIISLAQSTIDLGGGNSLAAASSQHSIVCHSDPSTHAVVERSASGRYHQVVCRAAKRTSTATFDVTGLYTGLYKTWSTDEADEYKEAATLDATYAAADSHERQKMNEAVRSQAKLEHVFRTLELQHDDDFIQYGYGLFPAEDIGSGIPDTKAFFQSIQILPELPFWVGTDYSDDAIEVGVDTTNAKPIKRKPLIIFQNPATTSPNKRYVRADTMGARLLMTGTDDDQFFSVDPTVVRNGKAISLDVNGGGQHLISGWQPPSAEDLPSSKWSIETTTATITVQDDRYVEAVSPTTLSTTVDAVRRIVLDFGDAFRRDYVLPKTVVEARHTLEESEGGYIRDDFDRLQSIANAAALYYVRERAILRLATTRPLAALRVGDLITTLNQSTPHAVAINTTISEISLTLGETENGPAPLAQMSIVTANSELDPMIFNPATFDAV